MQYIVEICYCKCILQMYIANVYLQVLLQMYIHIYCKLTEFFLLKITGIGCMNTVLLTIAF